MGTNGGGVGGVIGCVSGLLVRLWGYQGNKDCAFGVGALFSEQETRDYRKYDMTFFLDQTALSSSSSLSPPILAPKDILPCREAPPHSLQPEWHYHHN